ncbi:MAG: SPOR domain-containing protein [Sulfurimonas sp.]|nr:SPOR domain-containing protein [Sulfurimonas sp.]
MNETNELNDIILKKGGSSSNNKKIILAVATLSVVLIVVVMLMSTLTPDAQENLPQPIPLPIEQTQVSPEQKSEPLFEEVLVEEETAEDSDSLNEIAQRLKKESLEDTEVVEKVVQPKPKKIVRAKPKVKAPIKKSSDSKTYFIQVGSFSKYQPNKKFLDSILNQGYRYNFQKVDNLNKVLVGPFYTEAEARKALKSLRSNLEAGAFLVKY